MAVTKLNRDAKKIIVLSHQRIGDIALSIARNIKKGLDNTGKQRKLYETGFLIKKFLKVIYNHVEFDSSTGEIKTLHRITEVQLNKFLSCLVKLSDIQDYPVVPLLREKTKPILLTGGTKGEKGAKGDAGSDADIVVESDPAYDNLAVKEIAATSTDPKKYLIGYAPYTEAEIVVTIEAPRVYEIGVNVLSKNIAIKTTKGRADIATIEILNNVALNDALQAILDPAVYNGATQPVTNTISKSNITADFTVTGSVTDNINSSTDASTMNFYYPYLTGNSATLLTGSTAYSALTKSIRAKGTTTILLNGIDSYFYVGFPTSYGTITEILDGSGFKVEDDWELVALNVVSSGLDTNWTVGYNFYKTKIKTNINNQTYTFKH